MFLLLLLYQDRSVSPFGVFTQGNSDAHPATFDLGESPSFTCVSFEDTPPEKTKITKDLASIIQYRPD